MSLVLVNNLNIRTRPSFTAEKVGQFQAKDLIESGKELIIEENRIWLKFNDEAGNERYVCVVNDNHDVYVSVSPNIPGPRHIPVIGVPPEVGRLFSIPKQTAFSDDRIKNWGSCFLCICVKGGLTNAEQIMNCFKWGLASGKLRNSDISFNCNREQWAREISFRYGTIYHGDYCLQKNNDHFWLTQNGREIYNPKGLGWSE